MTILYYFIITLSLNHLVHTISFSYVYNKVLTSCTDGKVVCLTGHDDDDDHDDDDKV